MIDRGSRFPEPSAEPGEPLARNRVVQPAASATLAQMVSAAIGQDLLATEKLIQSAVSSRHAEVDRLGAHAAAMGGKRLRPALVFLSAAAAARPQPDGRGVEPQRDLQRIAAAVELVHAASLVHDDVMDEAMQRRHLPTVAHLAGGSAAILLGDYLFTKAYDLAAQCRSGIPARLLARASTALCEGELRQQMATGRWEMELRDYRSILLQKTGALCGVSCVLGGWATGADRRCLRALKQFGKFLGLAFQLYDDWLDYWGTEATGKTLGTDFQQGKPTLPVLRLLQQAAPAKRRSLLQLLNQAGSDKFSDILAELDDSDASTYTLGAAQRCVDRALTALAALPQSESQLCLTEIARFSVARVG